MRAKASTVGNIVAKDVPVSLTEVSDEMKVLLSNLSFV
jgi:hypothetical protein